MEESSADADPSRPVVPGGDQQRAEDLVDKIRDAVVRARGASPEIWAAFATHVPPGMPVFACGKEGGSWHRAVYLAGEQLCDFADSGIGLMFLDNVRGLLPEDQRDAERIRGCMDREWGAARESAHTGAVAFTAQPLVSESRGAGTAPPASREPHLDESGELVFPGRKSRKIGKRGGPILKALLKNVGRVVSRTDLGKAAWSDELTKDNTITQEIKRLIKKLEDCGYGVMAERIEVDLDQEGERGYVLRPPASVVE